MRSVALEVVPLRRSQQKGGRFAVIHFWLPVALLVTATWGLMVMHGDLWIADRLYAWEGYRWSLRQTMLTRQLFHEGGRDLSIAAWLAVLVAWAVSCVNERLAPWRRPLAYLLMAVVMATASVAWVKSWSNMDCPWDLVEYGGGKPYVGLFSLRPLGLDRGNCFPAGHASSGYAWMALYFFFLLSRPQWRHRGLVLGIVAGLLFGIDQQLRGAHFASHDLWSAGICWLVALGLYQPFRRAMLGDHELTGRRHARLDEATERLP